jgi:hypothetical protein
LYLPSCGRIGCPCLTVGLIGGRRPESVQARGRIDEKLGRAAFLERSMYHI